MMGLVATGWVRKHRSGDSCEHKIAAHGDGSPAALSRNKERLRFINQPINQLVLVHFKIYFSLSDMSQRQQAPFRSQLGLELIKMSIRFLPAHGKTGIFCLGFSQHLNIFYSIWADPITIVL